MIETKVSRISLIGDDILRIEYKADCYVDIPEYEENMAAYKKLMKSEKVYVLTIANPGAESSPEVRKIFASKERASFKHAEAFVINSLAHKIVSNFVVNVLKPVHKLKFFNTETEAMNWLIKQKKAMGVIKTH